MERCQLLERSGSRDRTEERSDAIANQVQPVKLLSCTDIVVFKWEWNERRMVEEEENAGLDAARRL